MTRLAWDQVGERVYETGVDHGVLYIPTSEGVYDQGYAWNGLTTVTESPSGAEASPQYADNIKYLNLLSAEEFGATVEAFTYPEEFAQCDGTASPEPGVAIGQQARRQFGLSYRTRVGNDTDGTEHGYKIHLIYGALAAPSEKAYGTINDSPEAITFSWAVTTTPVDVTGYKPTAQLVIDSTKVDATALTALEDRLYGTAGQDPELPLPDDVLAIFAGTLTVVPTVTQPTYVSGTHTLTIPSTTGVVYKIDGEVVPAGNIVITQDTVVTAEPAPGYDFPDVTDTDWYFDYV
jgi:hypothetical protein